MIPYLSDFDLNGSGYMNIGVRLVNDLVTRQGKDVLALGLNYNGREHQWPFRILPVEAVGHVQQILGLMTQAGESIEAIVVAMDLMLQEVLIERLKHQFPNLPYISLFPLEAPPLCQPWAVRLMQTDTRLVMSEFGRQALDDCGVASTHIPIGVTDLDLWRPPTEHERANIRQGLGLDEDSFVVLTVADNQERKNLGRSIEILSKFSVEIGSHSRSGMAMDLTEKRKMNWLLVTRIGSPVGWKLDDLGQRHGILGRMMMHERGLPDERLWMLFAAADAFLLTSKAEGLAIPVMEAMACKLPVIGTDCAAIAEHLADGRGLLIEPEYKYVDPYGNGWRYFAGLDDGVRQLERLANMSHNERQEMIDAAYTYVQGRNWETCGDVLTQAIDEAVGTYSGSVGPPLLPETVYA